MDKATLLLLCKDARGNYTTERIAEMASWVCEVHRQALNRRTRKGECVTARHLYVWFARNLTGITLIELGHSIWRDHTTIINSYQRAESLLDAKDEYFLEKAANVATLLNLAQYAKVPAQV